jgi:hypothetical protein
MERDHHGWWSTAGVFSAAPARSLPEDVRRMRFLWAYLLVVIVFAFGFLCASAFSAGED